MNGKQNQEKYWNYNSLNYVKLQKKRTVYTQ